jgi:hypothetical protein
MRRTRAPPHGDLHGKPLKRSPPLASQSEQGSRGSKVGRASRVPLVPVARQPVSTSTATSASASTFLWCGTCLLSCPVLQVVHERLRTLKFRSDVPDSRMFQVASEVLVLSIAVGDCTTIVQSRSKLSGPFIVILTAVLKSQLDHENPELLVRVIDVDEPGTGRIPRTLIRRFDELQPE